MFVLKQMRDMYHTHLLLINSEWTTKLKIVQANFVGTR